MAQAADGSLGAQEVWPAAHCDHGAATVLFRMNDLVGGLVAGSVLDVPLMYQYP